jgi:iduronate 2-sulfatase
MMIVLNIAALLGGNALVADEQPLKVFVLAGQSNMDGRGGAADLPVDWKQPVKNAVIFDGKAWVPVAPAHGTPGEPDRWGSFGPELGFSRRMSETFGQPIGIVKHGTSGTSLAKNWDLKDPKSHYHVMLNKIRAAQQSRKIEIVGMLWMQGEADSVFEPMAKAYAANLEALIQASRKDFGGPKMPFVAGRVNPPETGYRFVKIVRKAQESCRLPGYAFVDCDGFATYGQADLVHFNVSGQMALGQAFADTMLGLLGKMTGAPAATQEAKTVTPATRPGAK